MVEKVEAAERLPITHEDQEKYLIHSREAICQVLEELQKRPDIVTAYFNDGREYILTALLGVLRERDLVVLDPGPDEEKNRRLLDAGRIICITKHNDIDIRFELNGVKSARFHGQTVFAASLPQSLLRKQRRDYFRVNTPQISPILCRLQDNHGERMELPVADISAGGIALLDESLRFDPRPFEVLRQCELLFPGGEGSLTVDLEVRNNFLQGRRQGSQVRRIGLAFVDLSMDKNSFIQRYIHRLQIQQRNLDRD